MLGLVRSLHQPRLSANKAESSPFLCDRSSLGPFVCHCSVLRVSAPTFFLLQTPRVDILVYLCAYVCMFDFFVYLCVWGRGGQRRIVCVLLWHPRDLKTFNSGSLTESGATLSADAAAILRSLTNTLLCLQTSLLGIRLWCSYLLRKCHYLPCLFIETEFCWVA